MYLNNNLGVMDFAFPDVCNFPTPTPAGPVPTPMPWPDIEMSLTDIPTAPRFLPGCGLGENLATIGTVSNGDEAGSMMGVIFPSIDGPDRPIMGSTVVFAGGMPSAMQLGMSGNNGAVPNAPLGSSLTMMQIWALALR